MADFRDARALAEHQRARATRVRRSIATEHAALVESMKADAIELTSGSTSAADLARQGHPFGRDSALLGGRGRQRGSVNPLPVNRQSGELQRSLRVFLRSAGETLISVLQFTSPHAIVLAPGGLRNMVARGFWSEMRRRYEQKKRRLESGLRRAERG